MSVRILCVHLLKNIFQSASVWNVVVDLQDHTGSAKTSPCPITRKQSKMEMLSVNHELS